MISQEIINKHITLTYFAKSKSDKFVHNEEEHNDIRWFLREDLENPELSLIPAVKLYASDALNAS